jgi:hypothetical protein
LIGIAQSVCKAGLADFLLSLPKTLRAENDADTLPPALAGFRDVEREQLLRFAGSFAYYCFLSLGTLLLLLAVSSMFDYSPIPFSFSRSRF